jgi:predicted dehydrogenase
MLEAFWRMSRKLNIGVLGCANIAKKSMIPAIKNLSDHFNLLGIASRSPNKVDEFCDLFDTQAYYRYTDLLENPSLDAIYIPLPNSLHKEWIEESIQQGLHVLVEKSMACNFKDVVHLNDLAAKSGLLLMENFQFRFHPQLNAIKKLLNDGEIGSLRSIKSTFAFPPFNDEHNIRYSAELGGGALLDAGAYPLKIFQIFLGYEIRVLAASAYFDSSRCVDLWGSGFLGSNISGVSAHMNFGFDNFYQCELEVLGSKGRIYTDRIFTAPATHSVKIDIHKSNLGKTTLELNPSNHFENLLLNFREKIVGTEDFADEYSQNISQARLIDEFRLKSGLPLTS